MLTAPSVSRPMRDLLSEAIDSAKSHAEMCHAMDKFKEYESNEYAYGTAHAEACAEREIAVGLAIAEAEAEEADMEAQQQQESPISTADMYNQIRRRIRAGTFARDDAGVYRCYDGQVRVDTGHDGRLRARMQFLSY